MDRRPAKAFTIIHARGRRRPHDGRYSRRCQALIAGLRGAAGKNYFGNMILEKIIPVRMGRLPERAGNFRLTGPDKTDKMDRAGFLLLEETGWISCKERNLAIFSYVFLRPGVLIF